MDQQKIDAYTKAFVETLVNGGVPAPGGGDCWMCCFATEEDKSLGDLLNSPHILEHIEEKYFVPSLLARALVEFPVSQRSWALVKSAWNGSGTGYMQRDELDRTTGEIRSSLDKFIEKSLATYYKSKDRSMKMA